MMGFSCECDYDGDTSEWEWYWNFGGQRKSEHEQACCECNASLPDLEVMETPDLIIYSEAKYQAFVMNKFMTDKEAEKLGIEYDGFDPYYGLPLPIDPNDEIWEGNCDDLEEFIDDYIEAFSAETGWHIDEYERWERVSEIMLRCDRCDGLATAYTGTTKEGGLGYCDPGPGNLIDAHIGMVSTSKQRIRWLPDKNGVLNPRPWS
ncbi:MAG: hypothetical protein GY938_13445 [Ketobacter sp.]|nr:hypothetical protein [Ketobacter sp.]